MDLQKTKDSEKTKTMVQKMTTIYKTMSDKYNTDIRSFEDQVAAQDREKRQLREEISRLTTEKEEMTTKYERDIFKLKERIDTMSTDFADMLKSTYKKMQERIDSANQTYEGDHPGMGGGDAGFGGAAGASYDEGPGM